MVLKEKNNLPFSFIARSLDRKDLKGFQLADKLVNLTMYSGKKAKAFKIVSFFMFGQQICDRTIYNYLH